MNPIQHPIVTISGGIIIFNILIATALRSWGIEIPTVWVFSYQSLIVLPVVALCYWYFNRKIRKK